MGGCIDIDIITYEWIWMSYGAKGVKSDGIHLWGAWHTSADYGSQVAVVIKQGIWDNATYPWTDQTSSGYMGSIVAEIDNWINAISSNASITTNGMLPVKVREPSDSTNSGTRNGFGYKFPDITLGSGNYGPTEPVLLVHGTETSFILEVGDEFENDTQNNGFGDLGSADGHQTSVTSPGTAGFNNEAIVAYDTTDGEEFIGVGFKLGTASTGSRGFLAFKDTDGHWCFAVGTNVLAYDNVLNFWTANNGDYDTDPVMSTSTAYLKRLYINSNSPGGAISAPGFDNEVQGSWFSANSALYGGLSSGARLGNFLYLNNGTEAIVELGYASAAVRFTV